MEQEGNLDVLPMFEEAVSVVLEPVDELRNVVFEILKKKDEIQASVESEKEENHVPADKMIPESSSNLMMTPKPVRALIYREKGDSSVVKYKITSAPGMFVLGAAADKVWGDEVSEFYCDSLEPECQHACYNQKFPLSYVHYWVLHITFVSTPTLVYLGHAVHIIHKEKQLRDSQDGSVQKKPKYTDERGKVKIGGILFCTYMIQLITKIFLEVGFIVGQFYIFGFIFIPSTTTVR
ncbi:hypothetical protein Q5P01_000711 [Channa striata]|uniref:Connexin N-terminal domain-containing protein n=1 Tax=Channa striata TaxID=64152 RepID=A0AA88LMA9_CHASR|nr:hypothetical protein Q5P01_000711 [Channa striata]